MASLPSTSKDIKHEYMEESIDDFPIEDASKDQLKKELCSKDNELSIKTEELKRMKQLYDEKSKENQLNIGVIKQHKEIVNDYERKLKKEESKINEMNTKLKENCYMINSLHHEVTALQKEKTGLIIEKEQLLFRSNGGDSNDNDIYYRDNIDDNNVIITQNKYQLQPSSDTFVFSNPQHPSCLEYNKFNKESLKHYHNVSLNYAGILSRNIVDFNSNSLRLEISELQRQLKEKETENNTLQLHCFTIGTKLKERITVLTSRNNSLTEIHQEHKKSIKHLQRDKYELEEIILQQEDKIRDLSKTHKQLYQMLHQANHEIEEYKRYNANMFDIITDLKKINQKLQTAKNKEEKQRIMAIKARMEKNSKEEQKKTLLTPLKLYDKYTSRKNRAMQENEQFIDNEMYKAYSVKNMRPLITKEITMETDLNDNETKPNNIYRAIPFIKKKQQMSSFAYSDIGEKEQIDEFKSLMNKMISEISCD